MESVLVGDEELWLCCHCMARHATRAKQDALERVEKHAADEWKEEAKAVLLRVNATLKPWTTEDLKPLMTASTHEDRAWGAITTWAKRQGYSRQTGRWVLSASPRAHRRPMQEWISTEVPE